MNSYIINVDGINTITFTRNPTHAQWAQSMDRIFADPNFVFGSGMLIDRRDTPIQGTNDVRSMMRYVDKHEIKGETAGWALLVSDLGSYGMGRMAQQWSEQENSLAVFQKMDEAIAWLHARSTEPLNPWKW